MVSRKDSISCAIEVSTFGMEHSSSKVAVFKFIGYSTLFCISCGTLSSLL